MAAKVHERPSLIVDLCHQMCQCQQLSASAVSCSPRLSILTLHYLPFDQLAHPNTYDGILFFLDAVLACLFPPQQPPPGTANATAADTNTGIAVEVDLTGFTMASFMRHIKFFRRVAKHFQDKYPDKLEKCRVVNAPAYVRQVCTLLSAFVDARTMEKLEFVTP